MCTVECSLTVFFDDPFWVGVYERADGGKLTAARVVFGAEPKDYEVYDFFLKNWGKLRFGPPVENGGAKNRASPKRRDVRRRLSEKGVGTKAMQALKLEQETAKQESHALNRQKSAEEEERKRSLHLQKRREKHRGH